MPEKEIENIDEAEINLMSGRSFFWALGLFITISLVIAILALFVMSDDDIYYPLSLSSSLNLIDVLHTDETNSSQLLEQAREAIFNELDRYSGYLEPEFYLRVEEEFTGSYGGIGITVIDHEMGLSIMSVREDGPAGRAGLMTGDIIIKVDSTDLTDVSNFGATSLLRGQEGTPVTLLVERYGIRDTLEFELQRENLKLIHIPYAGLTENKTLYIRIQDFEAGLYFEIKDILDSLYFHTEDTVKAVILDLRGNPGGLLTEATAVSNIFLDKGHLIVGIKGRSIWSQREYHSSGDDLLSGLPLAVIVNRGSASAAEIMSGALKYAGRAVLVGDTTFGKGLVQQYSSYGDGSGMRLTTSRYYFEGNIFLNDPDAEVIDSADGIPPDYYYKSIFSEQFPRQLENSMLLREFALKNADAIIAYAPFTSNSKAWFEQFNEYARNNDFVFVSELTALAKFTRDEIIYGNHSNKALRAADKICRLSESEDMTEFNNYNDYIKARLYQIAIEARLGIAASYRDAILPYRPEILFTEKILAENMENRE